MISKLSGKLVDRGGGFVVLDVHGVGYTVMVPLVVEKSLDALPEGDTLHLETIYYLQIEQTRATPVLLGFQNSIQK